MKRFLALIGIGMMACIFCVSGAFATEFNGIWYPWNGTHWEPGPYTANLNSDSSGWNIPVDGYATWGYDSVLTGLYGGNEVAAIDMALTWYSDVSGFSFDYAGDGVIGDIQVGVYDHGLLNGQVVLAKAYNPYTDALASVTGVPDGYLGGDITFSNNSLIEWVDEPGDTSGDGQYDFFTDALHEVGHALGLDHPTQYGSGPWYDPFNDFVGVNSSIMEMYSTRGGAMNALSKYDIYLIQSLYGPGNFTPWEELDDDFLYTGTVPEPSTFLLLGIGMAALVAFRKKLKK